eukprot:4001021-Prymnesium_polylepis.1
MAETDANEQVCEFDVYPEQASQPEYAVSPPQPAQHGNRERDLTPVVANPDAQEGAFGLA